MLKIRNAKIGDAETVKKFAKEHFIDTYPEIPYENIRKLIEASMEKHCTEPTSFVLELNGDVVGYLGLGVNESKYTKEKVGEIHMVHIKEGYRGKGFSHCLIEYAENFFKSKGISRIEIETNSNNETALGLYRKHGYKLWRYRFKKAIL